jgi:hypothetical protein
LNGSEEFLVERSEFPELKRNIVGDTVKPDHEVETSATRWLVEQDYIQNAPIILHDNLQHESH